MSKVSILERAKTALVLDHPFFASLLMRKPLIETRSIPTAGVDPWGQIYYNPDFIEKLDVDQCVFLLAHEVMHLVYEHAARLNHRDRAKWNIAGDAVINDVLKNCKVGKFIEGGVDMPGSMDKTADHVYNELPDQPQGGGKGKGKGGGQGGGQGDDQQGPGGIGNDLMEGDGPLSQEELDRISAETRMAIAQAANAAKMVGNMPGQLAKIVAELIEVKTPWYEILEKYMTSQIKGDYSWQRPNRRYMPQGHYLPSVGTLPKMGEVVVQVDVSGSISKQELDHYNGHLKRILEQCNPERIHVLYTDTQVQRHDVFEVGEEANLEFYSGGGTDMPAGFAYLDKHGIDPEVFVCLTDGYTGWGSKPTFDVVWCISSAQQAPYGVNIHFELET